MEAVYKSGGASSRKATAEAPLVLDRPSIVTLKIAPESVLKFERRGDDLVLVLRDGQEVAVRGFFAEYPDAGRNDLVLEDGAGVQWWGQYTAPWKDFHFTEIEWNDAGGALLPDGVPGWLLGALGVLGVGAAASGGGGGGGGPAFIPPLLPAQNRGPEGKAEPVVTDQDKPVTGQVQATDPDRDTLTYTVAKGPEHGTVTVDPTTGQFVYTPKPGYEGPDSFEVTVSDGKGGTTTVKVPVTVSPVNDAPTAPDYTETTAEDTPVSGRVTGSDIDSGDTLTYTKGSDPAHGTVTVNPDGTYTYTPNPDFHGTDSFTVTVSDGHGGTTTSTVTVTVSPVNDAPVFVDGGGTPVNTTDGYVFGYDENRPAGTVLGTVRATDVDSATVTYSILSGNEQGYFAIDPVTGAISLTAAGAAAFVNDYEAASNAHSLTVGANDGTITTVIPVTLNEQNINDAPTAPGDTKTTNEDTPVSGQIVGSDADGDTLTYTKGSDPAHGTVTVNADGTYTYTPGTNFNGTDSFTVTVSDGHGGTTTSTVNVTVVPVNDAPTAPDYTKTTNEDTPVSGQVVGSDVEGDTLTYVKGSDPANGTVTVNADGTYTYTPNANFNGTDSFTVTVSDGHGGVTTSTVTVTIDPVNDAPVFVDGGGTPVDTATGYVFGYDENRPAGTVLGTVQATDVDSANVTYSILSGNDNGYFAIDPVTGAISLTPAGAAAFVNDYEAGANAHSLVIGATDGTATTTIPVTLNERNINDAPTVPDYAKTTDEDTPVSGSVVGSDVDGDTLTYAKGSDPSHGTVTVNADGTYTYTPGANFHGTDSFTVTVSDGHGGTTTSTVNVTINPVNDAPTAPNYNQTTNEDTPVSGKVVGSDVDGDTLTYAKGSDPAHGTVTVNADGTYTYVPGANFNGTDSFTVTVSDGHGGTTTSTVNVTINPVNDAPTAPNYNQTTNEDTPVNGKVIGSDVDGDALTYTKGSNPSNGSVTVNPDGTYVYTPNPNFNGTDTFTVTVSDGHGGTTTSTVTVTVDPVNDAPTVPNYNQTTNEDTPVSGQVVGSDVDGDTLTYTKGSDPAHGTVTVNADGTYTYTPGANFNGTDSFTVTVSDGHGGTTTSTITVTVDPVNDAPTVPNYTETTNEDTPVSGQVVGSDLDGDTLTYTKGSDPAHGTVTVNADGTYTYVPGANFHGTDSFIVTVSDGHGGTTTSTVTVTIDPVNDAPTAPNYTETTNEDTPVSGQVVGSDVDGDTLTYTKGSDPAHGTVTVNADGTYTYVPGANFNGTDSFTVTVSDGHGGTTTSTVNVTINPVNDAPTAPNYTETTNEDTPVSGQVVGSDVDGDTLTYTKGSDPAHGTVTVNADGTYTYVPGANFNGTDTFTVTVSDGHGGTTTSTVTVTIAPVNDAPTVPNYAQTTDEDTPVSGQVVGSDIDGDTLTYTKGSDPAHGTVTVNADGTYTYVPSANFNGTDTFTVTVSDGHGGTTTSTVTVTIDPVNDAPVFVDGGGTPVDTATGYVFGYDENRPAGTVLGKVQATDIDSATVTYSILSGNDNGYFAINPATGEISLTPAGAAAFVNDYEAGANAHSLVIGATDGTATTTIPVTLNEQNINDAPTVPDYAKTTDEDTPVSGQVVGSDVDGDALTYVKGSDPAHGTVTVNPDGTYTYVPGANFNGTDSFTVTVSDGHGGTTTSTVNVTINPVNDAPVFVDGGGTPVDSATGYVFGYDENRTAGTVLGTVRATDIDSATVTYSILSGNDNGYFAIHPATGAISLTAAGAAAFVNDYEAGANAHSLVVGASDGTVTTNIPVTLNEQNVNEAPTAPDDTKTTDEDTPVSGQIVGSDVDGDTLIYTKGSNPSNGTVTVNPNGTYTYVPNANFNGTDSFTVTVSDGHGGTTTSTVTVTVNPVNDPPTATATDAGIVSEGSLPGGIAAVGEPSVQSTGKISIADPDSLAGDLSVSLSGPTGVTSGGQPVSWTWDAGTHTLTGSVTVDGVTTEVMTVAVGNVTATGAGQFEAGYTVTLKAPIDHPAGNGEGVSNLQFQAHVTDGQTAAAPVSFDVPVKDDAPVLVNGEQSVDVAPINTNLMVILDLSGSMNEETPTRLSRAKAAVQNLIDGYDLYGEVRVQLVTFSTTGQAQQAWMTAAEAKALVQTLQHGGSTNYDAALATAMSGFSAGGKLQGAQNVSYFLTDGEPTRGDGDTGQLSNSSSSGSADYGIQAAEEAIWKTFLTNNKINSFALGLGSDLLPAAQGIIDPIAYNGNTGTNTNGKIVTDTSQLNDMLQGTISVPPTVSNLLTGGLGGSSGFGADGGHVSTLTIDGTVYAFDSSTGLMTKTGPATSSDYSYNQATHQVTIATDKGGKLVVDFDTGEFSYQVAPRTTTSHNYDETLSYQVVDRDGDASNVATQTLHVNYTPAAGAAALFTSADSLGLAGVDEVTVSIEQQQQPHDAPHFPFGDGPAWGGLQLSDMLQGVGAAESLHALLQAAFPPAFGGTQAPPTVLSLASSADSLAAYAPPVAPSLDDELHMGLALHH
ncbi:VCBS repeat-containing protein [Variovorax boronicumulans]|uniref:VCBS repeat-containing protein n=1 Tax=Variovorax boronicumulans TaxID=436515 RepID=A0AAW8DZQ6_9BURK|nr:Ig-like domain-containing protein [Variovorax boronicumulans]MDP9880196.1 VCBS repeat-containing protein [Variovorax boronicumulans]MDP9925080.1 VCBS repeat-containing protein [Variovorax boronicumulans]